MKNIITLVALVLGLTVNAQVKNQDSFLGLNYNTQLQTIGLEFNYVTESKVVFGGGVATNALGGSTRKNLNDFTEMVVNTSGIITKTNIVGDFTVYGITGCKVGPVTFTSRVGVATTRPVYTVEIDNSSKKYSIEETTLGLYAGLNVNYNITNKFILSTGFDNYQGVTLGFAFTVNQ